MRTNNLIYKTFLKQIASLQIIVGGVILIPSVVAVIYQEWYSFAGFMLSGLFTTLLGYVTYRLLDKTEEPRYKDSLAIAALGWLMIIVFGAIPYFAIAWLTPIEVMQQFVPSGFDYESSLIYFRNPI